MNSKNDSKLKVINNHTKNKSKLGKQLEQERTTEMEITWRVINRGVGEGEGGKVQRISSINGR